MRVGQQHFALQPPAGAPLVEHHAEVDQRTSPPITTKVSVLMVGSPPVWNRSHAADSTSRSTSSRNIRMPTDAIVSNLRWPYGMIVVGRRAGDAHADDADDVRGGVGEGVEAVGQHGDRAGGEPERDLRGGDDQIEEENAVEDRRDWRGERSA